MFISLRVKTKANKSNFSRVDWRRKLNIGIGLFFRFDIMANKKYRLTIIGSLKIYNKVTCRHAVFSNTYNIVKI